MSVPEPAGMLFGRSAYWGQIARIMRVTHSPPIQDCTPYLGRVSEPIRHATKTAIRQVKTAYQMHAMAARLKTGHSEPQIPKEARATTGKEM